MEEKDTYQLIYTNSNIIKLLFNKLDRSFLIITIIGSKMNL